MRSKEIKIVTLHPEGYVTDSREFDTLKAAKAWVKETGLNESNWNRIAESEADYNGWAKGNVALLEMIVNGERVQEWIPAWSESAI